MSVKDEMMSNANAEVYSERTIKPEPMATECKDQCSYSLIKMEKHSEDDTDTVSTHDSNVYIKQEEPKVRGTVFNAGQIANERKSSDTDVTVKDEIEIGPTAIQPQYIGSSLHTTDASKAELIQCGGADVALGTTIPGAALYRDLSKGSRSVEHGSTSGQIKKDKGLKGNILSTLLEKKSFSCDICHHKFKVRSYLVKHMRLHSKEKPYACNICDYKCSYKASLVKHNMHTHTGEKPQSCNICEYKCVAKSNLVRHMRTHTGEKPYSCHICEYKCKAKSCLVTHLRTHTGEKPYSCNICEYKCTINSRLVEHIRTHTGEKPYSCNICEYKCVIKSSLVTHMRTHTGEKPYSCNICEYKCADKSSLMKHYLRIHTQGTSYSCNICEYKCSNKSNLVKHNMRFHTVDKS